MFQGNPRLWPVLDVLARGEPIRSWSAVRHLGLIEPGDRAVLWVSGPTGGVYAVGRVTSEPRPDPDPGGWTVAAGRTRLRHHVGVDLTVLDQPIPRADLRADPRFATSQIIRSPRSGNPFPLGPDAWRALAERLPDNLCG